MKAVIEGMQVEGTPTEIAELHRALRGTDLAHAPLESNQNQQGASGEITEAFAMRVLQRKPLSEAQQKILSKLAAKHPTWTSFEELQIATGYSKAQLSGALGALGRRVAATPGFAPGMVFLTWDWDESASSYNYFLPDPTFAAIERAGL
jgi:hypothetical protein